MSLGSWEQFGELPIGTLQGGVERCLDTQNDSNQHLEESDTTDGQHDRIGP